MTFPFFRICFTKYIKIPSKAVALYYSPFTLESGFTCTPRVAVLVIGGDSRLVSPVAAAFSSLTVTCIALYVGGVTTTACNKFNLYNLITSSSYKLT